MHMSTAHPITAKVFKSGNSTAIRLPRSLKLKAKAYIIEQHAGSFRLIDPAYETKRLKALKALRGSAPDFPDHTT
jgi:virulence-associated protein VagC